MPEFYPRTAAGRGPALRDCEGPLFRHVLVCLDRVPEAAHVLEEAVALAHVSGAAVTAMRVLSPESAARCADPVDWELARREHTADLVYVAEAIGAAESVRPVVTCGSVPRCVREVAQRERVDLIAVGAGAKDYATPSVLGGTARHLAETFPGSVLIVPERAAEDRPRARRVIVPMDGSLLAEAALRYGGEIARDRAAELVVLHAVSPVAPVAEDWTEPDDGALLSRMQQRSERAARKRLERLNCLLPRHRWGSRLVRLGGDDPRRALLRAIVEENGELVVLAARGLGSDPDLPIGSTSEYLLSRATTPTLLLRRAEESRHRASGMAPRRPRARAGERR